MNATQPARVVLVIGAVSTLVGMAASASASPGTGSGLGIEQYDCGAFGVVPVSVPNDNSPAGFTAGAVFIATEITLTDGDTVVFHKTYGQRNGAGAPITCYGQVDGYNAVAVVVPVGQAAKS